MTTYKIQDAGDLRKYYTQVPNMIDDAGLSLIAFRLYVHLKRVAGENGECYQSTSTLATACNMSAGAISKAKAELIKAELIEIEVMKDKEKQYHSITIKDVWAKNLTTYTDSLSRGEHSLSLSEQPRSPGETKNNPIKNDPVLSTKRESAPAKPTTPAADMRPMVEAIAQVTGDDPKLNYSVLARESKALITAGYTPAQVLATFGPGCAWYKKDWRGKKGARPDTFQVRKEIAKLINDVSDTRPPEVGNLAPVFNDTKSATRQKSQFEKEYGL